MVACFYPVEFWSCGHLSVIPECLPSPGLIYRMYLSIGFRCNHGWSETPMYTVSSLKFRDLPASVVIKGVCHREGIFFFLFPKLEPKEQFSFSFSNVQLTWGKGKQSCMCHDQNRVAVISDSPAIHDCFVLGSVQ